MTFQNSTGRYATAFLALIAPSLAQTPPPCAGGIPAGAPWSSACVLATAPSYFALPPTGVAFSTSDGATQALFDHAESCALKCVREFAAGFPVLVEGGSYGNVWLETQPMGGAMFGVRNLTLAFNNQLVFVRTQREDGRLPGMVTTVSAPAAVVNPTYSWPGNAELSMLQGFYMASPAVDVAVLANASGADAGAVAAFLAELAPALARFEGWLWAERNSSHGVPWLNGTSDTGEDNSDKFACTTTNCVKPPYESMDMAGYAHDAQRALARVAALRGDAAGAAAWAARAAATAAALKARLWRAELGAAFDRGRDTGDFVTTLVHNNLRAMWHGAFDQGMADAFLSRHLMNTSEFWTAAPLASISVADERFRDDSDHDNDWSGPPQGLTYQRALRALESYGHHAELLLAGAAQRAALLKTLTFPQQIDPFTAQPDAGRDCYGPMQLSLLEFTALKTGVAVRAEPPTLLWSAVAAGAAPPFSFTFEQRMGGAVFRLDGFANGTFTGSRDGVPLFWARGSTRIVTRFDGAVVGVVGAGAEKVEVDLQLPGGGAPLVLTVAPNEEWGINGPAAPVLARKVPFTPPY